MISIWRLSALYVLSFAEWWYSVDNFRRILTLRLRRVTEPTTGVFSIDFLFSFARCFYVLSAVNLLICFPSTCYSISFSDGLSASVPSEFCRCFDGERPISVNCKPKFHKMNGNHCSITYVWVDSVLFNFHFGRHHETRLSRRTRSCSFLFSVKRWSSRFLPFMG